MASSSSGGGYWLASADGGVFAYGQAPYLGSMAGTPLNAPIVGIAADPTGGGYWEVAADGGIFNFGNAGFFGSMGGRPLNAPIVGIASTPDGNGYWLVGADGGVFNFGDAAYMGSEGGQLLPAPIAGIATAGPGYWLAGRDGSVYAFGAPNLGNAASGVPDSPPVVAIATTGADSYWLLEGEGANDFSMSPGPGLAALQQRLQDLGYWDGGPTGTMNDATEQAIWAFQKYENQPLSGTLDASEFAQLATAARPQASVRTGNAIEVNTGPDLLFIVQNGYTAWVFNTSTGGGYRYRSDGVTSVAVTPDGTFNTQYGIDGWHTSPLGLMWRPRFFVGGYALHGDTVVPPTPVSHGCVRVSIEAMDFIWTDNLDPVGEKVYVHG